MPSRCACPRCKGFFLQASKQCFGVGCALTSTSYVLWHPIHLREDLLL